MIAYVLGMDARKLRRWYINSLSGFKQEKESGDLLKNDLKPFKDQVKQKVRIPIVVPQNIGLHMAIDEKYINGEYYTILSNRQTTKIALMIKSMYHQEIRAAITKYFGTKTFMVKTITKDGSDTFDWVARTCFPNAIKILDKFHIVRSAFEHLQSIRINLKQEHLKAVLDTKKDLEKRYHEALKQAQINGNKKPDKNLYHFKEPTMSNGETILEILHRSRYALYKYPDQWKKSQIQRMEILFKSFPVLGIAYEQVCNFRLWYHNNNVGKPIDVLKSQFETWLASVKKSKIQPIITFGQAVNSKIGQILNYFYFGYTNAKAETLNGKISRFIILNYGVRNIDYFTFRLKILFA